MADNVVQVVIRAKDEAKAQIAAIAGQLKDLGVSAEVGAVGFGVLGAAVLAAGATFAVLGRAATDASVRLDKLNEISQQTGVAASTLSQLEYAASQTNASLDGLNTGLRFLARNLFEARSGGKEQIQTLQALGFTAKDIQAGLGGTEKALLSVAERIAAIEDPGTRAAIVLKLFGRGGAELIPLLSQGADGIRKFQEEADRLGITVSNTAAAIGDQFRDSLAASKLQVDGLKASIAEALLPSLTQLVLATQPVIAAITKITKESPSLVKAIFEVSGAFAALGGTIALIVGAVALAKAALATFGVSAAAAAAAGGPITLLIVALGLAAVAIQTFRNEAEKPFQVKIVTNAEEAGAELARLAREREKAEQDLARLREKAATASPTIRVNPATGRPEVDRENTVDSAAIVKAEERLRKFDLALKEAASNAKALVPATGSAFDPLGASAEKAKPKVDELLAAIAKATGLPETTIDRKLFEPDLTLRGVTPLRPIEPGPELPELDLKASEQEKALASLNDMLEDFGINVDALNAKFAASQTTIASLEGAMILFGTAFDAAVSISLDPVLFALDSANRLANQLVNDGLNLVTEAFDNLFIKSQKGFDVLRGLIVSLFGVLKKLAIDIAATIAQIVIIKALKTGLGLGVAGGGEVQGPVLRDGGQIAGLRRATVGLAAGGAILASGMASPVHAASGLSVVPGSPQRFDSVPAILAPGEVVLPFINGKRPADVLGTLAQVPELVAKAVASSLAGRESGSGGPFIGQVVIQAQDADSVGNAARSGELAIQLERLAILGR